MEIPAILAQAQPSEDADPCGKKSPLSPPPPIASDVPLTQQGKWNRGLKFRKFQLSTWQFSTLG